MNNKMKFISNPMLVGAMELVKKNKSQENLKLFMDELLHARLISPIIITPPPTIDENGKAKLTEENKISIPMIPGPDDKKYFMGYTDMEEVNKWTSQPKHQMIAFKFADYVHMLLKPDCEVNGIVINPFDHNLVITKDMVLAMLKKGNYSEEE